MTTVQTQRNPDGLLTLFLAAEYRLQFAAYIWPTGEISGHAMVYGLNQSLIVNVDEAETMTVLRSIFGPLDFSRSDEA